MNCILLRDAHGPQMHDDENGQRDREKEHPQDAEKPDRQAAKNGRTEKRHPIGGTDQTVRSVSFTWGIKTVTSVDDAIPRILPAMAPPSARMINTQSMTLVGSAKILGGVAI